MMQNKALLSPEEIAYNNKIHSSVIAYLTEEKNIVVLNSDKKSPQIGDISIEYPYGYGLCQCGCGKKTSKFKEVYPKFRKLHSPEKIKERKEQKLLKRRERYAKNEDKRKARYIKNRDKILARTRAYRLLHPNYDKEYCLKNREKRKLWRLQNKDKLKAKSQERYYKDVELSRKNAREKAQLHRFENKEKYLIKWREYSKENREHRRVLEKQSLLRAQQTKKYLIPKLIKTLKKILSIKKKLIELNNKKEIITVNLKKQSIRKLIIILKRIRKIKRQQSYQPIKQLKIKRHFEYQKRQKETLSFRKTLQSQLNRPLKNIITMFGNKMRLTYGKTQIRNGKYSLPSQKLNEYLLWYINIPKVCDYCGIPEESLINRPDLCKKSSHLEIDRKNPIRNYELNNIHLVCSICNMTKLHILTCDEMKKIGPRFIFPKWNNPYTPKTNKNLKIIHYPTSLKNSTEFPEEYPIWIKLKKRASKAIRIGRKLSYLSFEEFLSWFKAQEKKCIYCGISETLLNLPKIKPIFSWCSDRLTIDRVSPTDGYISKNMVLSCLACNTIKSNIFTFEEMKEIGIVLRKKWQNILKGALNG